MKVFTRILPALVFFHLTVSLFSQNILTKVTDTTNPIVSFSPTGGYTGATWVDYDNDDDLDLFTNDEFLFRNDGNGVFTQIASTTHGILSFFQAGDYHNGHTWGDFDNDGWIDVYMTNRNSKLYKNKGDGTFAEVPGNISTGVNAWAGAFGDYDEDGWLDLVVVHPRGFIGTSHVNWLFKSDGSGGFTSVSNDVTDSLDAYTIASWSDHDLDGDLDLFIGTGEVSSLDEDNIYFNQLSQNGNPELVQSYSCQFVCTDKRDGQNWNWIDYDNDGDLDGFVTNFTKTNDFYRNDGNGAFHKLTQTDLDSDMTSVLTGNGLTNVWADFNNDGFIDVYIGNDGGGQDFLYLNDGDGTFTKTTQSFVAGNSRGATAGDYDLDGDIDLFVSAAGPVAKGLFRNEGNSNSWTMLKLTGKTSNKSAIGAVVRVKATIGGNPVWQIREVSSQNSFCGSNALDIHFGLGNASVIDSMIIDWPNGLKESFANVPVNIRCKGVEGEGLDCIENPSPEVKESVFFEVYPNPVVAGAFKVEFKLPESEDVSVALVNAEGDTVLQNSFSNVTENQLSINSDKFPSGIYAIILRVGTTNLTKRLILAHKN